MGEFEGLEFPIPPGLEEFDFPPEDADFGYTDPDWAELYDAGELTDDDPNPEQLRIVLKEPEPALSSLAGIEGVLMATDPDGYEQDDAEVDVPGSPGAAAMYSAYTNPPPHDYRAEQWDIVIEMDEYPMYQVRYFAPEDEFNEDYADALLDSLEVNR
ncbi:hypothetical protein [Lipingzhangella rawalii]|nr:hypothetical protein [Lipingzhangella rawalii]